MTRQPNKGTQVPHGPTSQLPRYGGWAAKGLRATRRRPFGLAVGRFLSGDAALVKSRGRRQRGSAGVCFLGCGTGKVGLKVGSRAGGNSGREVEGTPKPSFSGLRPCDQPEQEHTRAPTAKGLTLRVLWFPTVPMLSSSCGLQLAFLVAFGEVHPGDRGDGRGNMWGTLNSDFHATCFVRTFVRAQNVQWIWGLHYCSHCRVDEVWNGVRTTFSVYPRCGPGDDGPDGCNLGVSEGLVSLWPMVGAAICRVASPNCVVAVWGTRVELGLPRVGDSSPSAETHRGSFSCGIHSDPLCSRAKSSKVPYDGCAKSMPSRAQATCHRFNLDFRFTLCFSLCATCVFLEFFPCSAPSFPSLDFGGIAPILRSDPRAAAMAPSYQRLADLQLDEKQLLRLQRRCAIRAPLLKDERCAMRCAMREPTGIVAAKAAGRFSFLFVCQAWVESPLG